MAMYKNWSGKYDFYLAGVDVFEKKRESVRFLSPLADFREVTQDIEYRKDPLTGKWSRVNIQRAERIKQGQGASDYSELVRKSRDNCFFCPENIEKSTPRFDSKIVPGGYITRGETRIFPNLFPFARHHAVGTITKKHFLSTGEFEKKQIEDTILAGLDFCRTVQSNDRKASHVTFNWNHLFPSGASIIHPHVQITLDSRPTYMTEKIIEASRRYLKRKGENYWERLVVEEERIGTRFIGRIESIAFLSSYSPFGNNEVLIVFDDRSSFEDLDEKEVSNLSNGIIKVLKGYESIGIESFNLTTYSGSAEAGADGFKLNMRFVSRSPASPYYTSDIGFMEGLHFERIVESLPEDVARNLRKFF